MQKIAAVILNYRNLPDTLACAESLLRSEPAPQWVVVVDNASPDDSWAGLQAWAAGNAAGAAELTEDDLASGTVSGDAASKRLFLILASSNRGYAAGNNLGIRLGLLLGADAFLLCNNDTVFEPDAVAHMAERLFAADAPGLCGPLLCYQDQPKTVQCRAGGYTSRWTGLSRLNGQGLGVDEALEASPAVVESELNFIYGACVMASRAFVETVGLMDEGYFLYCEEQEWAWSAKGRFSLAYAPRARVFHKEGATTGWQAGTFTLKSMYRIGRSRLRLHFRHAPWTVPVVAFCLAAALPRKLWRMVKSILR